MNKVIVTLIIGLSLLLAGCGWLYESGPKAGVDLTEAELFVPEFEYINQNEQSVSNEQLQGTVWIANMVFTRCPTVCTTMTPNMRMLQDALAEEKLDVKLVSFTVDPEFDSPDILKSYGENNGAEFDKWMFLSGYTQEEITEFAAEAFLAPVSKLEDSNDMIHATSFYLVDETGQVIRKYDGLALDPDPIVADVKKVLK
ncbi:SCO family protein [Alkalihalobacterium bogoriense]|uniref:SCO family protein n=1 Tax=Alkalihalobacterium bogoriense TaxID=246272 RepID=UPI000478690A|nr:SCO family protein [Alkalihalobacterium bogoriense]